MYEWKNNPIDNGLFKKTTELFEPREALKIS